MSAIAFDTLKYARRLMEAGVPEKQAEVQAELMAEAFVYNMDDLVTKDQLEARFAEVKGQLTLHSWILGAIAASTVLPFLHSLFNL